MKTSSIAMFVVMFAAGIVYMPHNPTQRFGQLVSLVVDGVPGGENMTAFDAIYAGITGNKQQDKAHDSDVANSFYNLATKFYEYGWGDSFHFGWRKIGEPHSQSIANSQRFVAQKVWRENPTARCLYGGGCSHAHIHPPPTKPVRRIPSYTVRACAEG